MAKVYGVLPEAGIPPSTPQNLVLAEGTLTASAFGVEWDDAVDATSWTVYLDGAPYGPAATPFALFTDLAPPSTLFNVQVQAHSGGLSSALSAVLPVTLAANTSPEWNLADQTGQTGQGYSLSFSSVCSDADSHALTFAIVSGSVPGVQMNSNVNGLTGAFTTVGVFPLELRANDGYVDSDTTVQFTISSSDVTGPTTPVLGQATSNGSTVTVPLATASTDASGVLNYDVYRSGNDVNYGLRGTIVESAFPFIETGVPDGNRYYKAQARDASPNANLSALSAATLVVVSSAPPAPDTPTPFTATTISASRIDLAWADGPNGAASTDFELDFSTTSSSGPWTSIPVGLQFSYSHTGRSASTPHWYRLRGINITTAGPYATGSATTLPASGSAILWNPGHYIASAINPSASQVTTQINFVNARSYLRGYVVRYFMPQLETSQGVYNWSLINTALSQLNSDKRLFLQLQYSLFNVGGPSLNTVVPSYMQNGTYAGGGWADEKSPGVYDINLKMWNANVGDRVVALMQAFGDEFSSNPKVAGWVFSELAFGINSGNMAEAGFSASTFHNIMFDTVVPAARPAMPDKEFIVYGNFISGSSSNKFERLRDACRAGYGIMGGPDTEPCNGGTTGHQYTRGVVGSPAVDLRGKIGINCGTQNSDLSGSRCPTWSGTQYVQWMRDTQKATHIVTTYIPSTTLFGQIMTYVENNYPNTHVSAYPSEYP